MVLLLKCCLMMYDKDHCCTCWKVWFVYMIRCRHGSCRNYQWFMVYLDHINQTYVVLRVFYYWRVGVEANVSCVSVCVLETPWDVKDVWHLWVCPWASTHTHTDHFLKSSNCRLLPVCLSQQKKKHTSLWALEHAHWTVFIILHVSSRVVHGTADLYPLNSVLTSPHLCIELC